MCHKVLSDIMNKQRWQPGPGCLASAGLEALLHHQCKWVRRWVAQGHGGSGREGVVGAEWSGSNLEGDWDQQRPSLYRIPLLGPRSPTHGWSDFCQLNSYLKQAVEKASCNLSSGVLGFLEYLTVCDPGQIQ